MVELGSWGVAVTRGFMGAKLTGNLANWSKIRQKLTKYLVRA